jgi:hypothetical protein
VLPVGTIFISVSSTNPATSLGYGTWVAFGAGRVLVGLDGSNTAFDAAEETGGALAVSAAGANSAPAFTGAPLGTHTHGVGTYLPSAHAGAAVADHAAHTHTFTASATAASPDLVGDQPPLVLFERDDRQPECNVDAQRDSAIGIRWEAARR